MRWAVDVKKEYMLHGRQRDIPGKPAFDLRNPEGGDLDSGLDVAP